MLGGVHDWWAPAIPFGAHRVLVHDRPVGGSAVRHEQVRLAPLLLFGAFVCLCLCLCL